MSERGRPLVIDAEGLEPRPRAWLEERVRLEACGPSEARWPDLLREAAGLIVRTYTRVHAGLLEGAPHLRVVGRAGVGLDNIDVDACKGRGVVVVNTPDANAGAVSEYVFALLLDALRPRWDVTEALAAEPWAEQRATHVGKRELAGLTLGVWGLGRVGSRVARIGQAFGMRVLFNDIRQIPPSERDGYEEVDRPTLLGRSDVLTLHVDGRAENRGLLDAAGLALVQPDAILVNTSRGFVVDAAALADFLHGHPRARAILDVHAPEPFGEDYPLLGLPNARLLPHLGAATVPARERMSWVVRDVARVLGVER